MRWFFDWIRWHVIRWQLRRAGVTLTCMRVVDTWRWSDHLGKKTEGTCSRCNAPIYFEEQNAIFPDKICNKCDERFKDARTQEDHV